jgi:periplasmic protein TonB
MGKLSHAGVWLGLAVGSLFVHAVFFAGSFLLGEVLSRSGPGALDRSVMLSVAIQQPALPLPPDPPPEPAPPPPRARPELPKDNPPETEEAPPAQADPAQPPADPIDAPAEPAAPPAPTQALKRIVGLSLESTVTGAAGPSFAVGNTRMGQTDRVANAPANLPLLPKSKGEGDRYEPPLRLRSVTPQYPSALKDKGIEGEVELSVDIDERGAVTEVRVVSDPEHQEFAAMAIEATMKSLYAPAKRHGIPVATTIQFTVRFRITEERG